MELKDLVGAHRLSGVDRETRQVKSWGKQYEDCDVIRFVLDDTIYMAIEDLEDGYRSSMKEIVVSDMPIKNPFPGIEITAKMRDDEGRRNNEVLELFDAKNDKLILAIGTTDYDDYYPCWVAEFIPENMYINEGVQSKS